MSLHSLLAHVDQYIPLMIFKGKLLKQYGIVQWIHHHFDSFPIGSKNSLEGNLSAEFDKEFIFLFHEKFNYYNKNSCREQLEIYICEENVSFSCVHETEKRNSFSYLKWLSNIVQEKIDRSETTKGIIDLCLIYHRIAKHGWSSKGIMIAIDTSIGHLLKESILEWSTNAWKTYGWAIWSSEWIIGWWEREWRWWLLPHIAWIVQCTYTTQWCTHSWRSCPCCSRCIHRCCIHANALLVFNLVWIPLMIFARQRELSHDHIDRE